MIWRIWMGVLALLMISCDRSAVYKGDIIQLSAEPVVGEQTFTIQNNKLVDLTGHEFVLRGINMPFAYYYDKSFESLSRVAELRFNSVRIVWCADNLIRPGRCEPKDFHTPEELESVLKQLKKLKMVAVLNLQNATGSDDPLHLASMVDWYLQPEVMNVLKQYQEMTLINVANEWFGSWYDQDNIYLHSYTNEISRLRKGGVNNVLIIDAGGWGQQFSSILNSYKSLIEVDHNIMFSLHMYDVYSSSAQVAEDIAIVRSRKFPFIIGEFACSHYPGQSVACETVMEQANVSGAEIGYIAWSYSGNGDPLSALNLVDFLDWKTLSDYGRIIVDDPNGISKSSKEACLFHVLEGCEITSNGSNGHPSVAPALRGGDRQ